MMIDWWQHATILLVVAGAVGYLAYRLVRWRSRKKSCADCQLLKAAYSHKENSSVNSTSD